jgi:hypothetical protein
MGAISTMRESLSPVSYVSKEEVTGISDCFFSGSLRVASMMINKSQEKPGFFSCRLAGIACSLSPRRDVEGVRYIPHHHVFEGNRKMMVISLASYLFPRAVSRRITLSYRGPVGNDKQARWLGLGRGPEETRDAPVIRDLEKDN